MADTTTTTRAQVLDNAKTIAIEKIRDILFENGAEQHGNYDYAIPVDSYGNEVWVTVSVVAHNYKDTAKTKAFDVFEEQADWLAEKEAKEKARQIAEQNKAAKLARKKARSSKSAE